MMLLVVLGGLGCECLPVVAGVTSALPDTSATLQRATQALVDALAPGERDVWEHYSDPSLIYVTEDNEVKSRTQLLGEMQPLPSGSSGSIAVQEFHCTDFGSFAVTTYIMAERETIEGYELHARYRGSDTWRASAGGWRLVAAQVYAVPQDPPRGEPAGSLADYEGVYGLSNATRQTIRRDGDHLVADRPGRPPQLLVAETGDVFFTPGHPRTRRIFTRAPGGHVIGFADRREGTDLVWSRLRQAKTSP
ncbi:MAG TPA: nuclear transport factor 2 family protein [Steroidobacteraceae bacterium]